jgi:hypothetical protein
MQALIVPANVFAVSRTIVIVSTVPDAAAVYWQPMTKFAPSKSVPLSAPGLVPSRTAMT